MSADIKYKQEDFPPRAKRSNVYAIPKRLPYSRNTRNSPRIGPPTSESFWKIAKISWMHSREREREGVYITAEFSLAPRDAPLRYMHKRVRVCIVCTCVCTCYISMSEHSLCRVMERGLLSARLSFRRLSALAAVGGGGRREGNTVKDGKGGERVCRVPR